MHDAAEPQLSAPDGRTPLAEKFLDIENDRPVWDIFTEESISQVKKLDVDSDGYLDISPLDPYGWQPRTLDNSIESAVREAAPVLSQLSDDEPLKDNRVSINDLDKFVEMKKSSDEILTESLPGLWTLYGNEKMVDRPAIFGIFGDRDGQFSKDEISNFANSSRPWISDERREWMNSVVKNYDWLRQNLAEDPSNPPAGLSPDGWSTTIDQYLSTKRSITDQDNLSRQQNLRQLLNESGVAMATEQLNAGLPTDEQQSPEVSIAREFNAALSSGDLQNISDLVKTWKDDPNYIKAIEHVNTSLQQNNSDLILTAFPGGLEIYPRPLLNGDEYFRSRHSKLSNYSGPYGGGGPTKYHGLLFSQNGDVTTHTLDGGPAERVTDYRTEKSYTVTPEMTFSTLSDSVRNDALRPFLDKVDALTVYTSRYR